MTVSYREMREDDYEGLLDLWLETPGMGLNDVDDSREGISRFIKKNPGTSFVAEDDGVIVGSVLGGNDGRRGYIYHMAVREEYSGKHVGKTLAVLLMEAMKKEDISKVCLTAFRDNDRGNGFWEHLGFPDRTDITYRSLALKELGELKHE